MPYHFDLGRHPLINRNSKQTINKVKPTATRTTNPSTAANPAVSLSQPFSHSRNTLCLGDSDCVQSLKHSTFNFQLGSSGGVSPTGWFSHFSLLDRVSYNSRYAGVVSDVRSHGFGIGSLPLCLFQHTPVADKKGREVVSDVKGRGNRFEMPGVRAEVSPSGYAAVGSAPGISISLGHSSSPPARGGVAAASADGVVGAAAHSHFLSM